MAGPSSSGDPSPAVRIIVPIVLGIVFVGLWEFFVRYYQVPKFVLPPPSMIVEALVSDVWSVYLATDDADKAAENIRSSVETTRVVLLVMLLIAAIVAALAGYWLLRAVTTPMAKVLKVVDVMRTGDLTQRLHLNRADEIGALEAGFNRMTDELTALVGQAQKSAVQVTTSVTEIAATSR